MTDSTNLGPRALAAAERQAPTLRISYDGDPVRVEPEKITKDMLVPDVGDIECGQAAASLVDEAVAAGALTTPAGLEIDCFADDDSVGGLFMLVISPDGERHGATYGWHEVENLSVGSVKGALNFCADQLNRALNPPTAQSFRCTRPAGIEI